MSDLVSIVIPIYNSGEYLEECLNSILLQDYMNWEAILVNDGSTDRSEMICKQFASQDTRFKVIDKENGGVSSARNSGLSEANGDYICFIDSDDYIKNNYLSHLYGLIKTHNAKLALCKFDKGEEKVSDILNNLNLLHERQYKFKNCKNNRPLPFDFYLPDYNVCIEYNGEYHYEPVDYSGKGKEWAENKFKHTQKVDNIKRNYCKDNNIKLIEIPYWELNNIEEILKKELNI